MLRLLRRTGITLAGGAVVAVGLALLVLPGPGLLVVAAGLGILATEYLWARRALRAVLNRAWETALETAESPLRLGLAVLTAVAMAAAGIAALVAPGLPFGGPLIAASLLFAAALLVTTLVASVRMAQREQQEE